jgi:hypothetical protein
MKQQPYVYFLRAGADGPVKVGLATDPMARMQELQTGNHVALIMIGVIRGGADVERAIQRELVPYRIRGEWFRPEPLAMAVIGRRMLQDLLDHPGDEPPRVHHCVTTWAMRAETVSRQLASLHANHPDVFQPPRPTAEDQARAQALWASRRGRPSA